MKIEKIEIEMQKTREKIAEYQNRLKELDGQKTEAENLQIIQLVRSLRIPHNELKAYLLGETQTAAAPIAADSYTTKYTTTEQEDSEDD
jgi:hypothetical protein